ncbi:ribosome maturation factor RimM [Pseudolysinimonas kribbensis]|uniref:Ribosome maturation factor RimM n=1 Tax=Pseudolysinimonas kribbensis TaxID=433641 RepID=A0ABQ6K3T3_9MICO|nr:ribosome maturation factor RimM [Pseudolysinimonas kribbensis]GMA93964.1 ribosome maturation factor RimM [Pseudolysinimonas kribbensis]
MSARAKAPRPGTTQLRVARLVKAHGLKGALKLELYTDDPERRFQPGATFALQVPTSSEWHGKTLELRELRVYNGHPVAFFAGVDDRTAAETLVKAILWVDHDETELPEEQDAWYDHQLVGLRALRDGVEVGLVARVDHLPAQDLLAIAVGEGEVLVPFVAAIVPAVDIEAGTVTLTPPAGLFEDLPDDDPEPAATTQGTAAPSPEPAPVEPTPPAAD